MVWKNIIVSKTTVCAFWDTQYFSNHFFRLRNTYSKVISFPVFTHIIYKCLMDIIICVWDCIWVHTHGNYCKNPNKHSFDNFKDVQWEEREESWGKLSWKPKIRLMWIACCLVWAALHIIYPLFHAQHPRTS